MGDCELIEDLRTALDEAAADLRLLPDAALLAQRRGRRRRAARGLLVGLPAVALAVGVVIGFAEDAPPRPPNVSIDYVTAHTEAALTRANGYIIQTTQQVADETVMTWTDPTTMATRQQVTVKDGEVTLREMWSARAAGSGGAVWHSTFVDHLRRVWWTTDVAAVGPLAQKPVLDGTIVVPTLIDPIQIAEAMKYGQVRIGGYGDVAGIGAIKLLVTGKSGYVTQLWIDGKTYEPVHMDYPPGSGLGIEVTWLPKTAALGVRTRAPRIPAGYSQINDSSTPDPVATE
jgi:hypothetical protein